MPPLSKEALAHDNAILREFRASQAYDVWNKYLVTMAEDVNNRLMNSITDPLDQLRYFQGVLAGIKMSQQVPESVEVAYKTLDKK